MTLVIKQARQVAGIAPLVAHNLKQNGRIAATFYMGKTGLLEVRQKAAGDYGLFADGAQICSLDAFEAYELRLALEGGVA